MTEVSRMKAEHFRRRLKQRHGITLSDKTFKRFCEIRKAKGAAVQLSCRLGLHKIDFAGILIAVIWDRKHDVPVTTLPDTAIFYSATNAYRWANGRIECLPKKMFKKKWPGRK